MSWIGKMFEDANGIPDDARMAAFLIVLTFIGNSIASLVMGAGHFDPQAFGIGAAALATGFGAWFGLRNDN